MDGGVTGDILKDERRVDQLARDLLVVVGRLEVGRFSQRVLERDFQLGRHHLGQAIPLAIAQPHHPAHVANHRLGPHRAEGDDLCHRVAPVFFPDVLDHLLAAVVSKVDVYIRRADPFRVQEPLEDQPVPQRIDVGNFQQIGHQ